jgi:hypothetical protein
MSRQGRDMTTDEINNFSLAIEELVYMKDISYIDAIVIYCEETGFEIEMAGKLVSGVLKAKIQIEAEDLHYITKSDTMKLPL